jgi:hypothetical protein
MTTTVQRAAKRRRRWALGLSTVFACGLAAFACTEVRAEVRVEGDSAAVRVVTDHAAISDVLSAFAGNFKVRYRTSVPLDAAANATYAGSFGQVISRLLDGYNYVVKKDQDTTEIIVFGRHGQVAIPAPVPKAAPAAGILSRWR